MKKFIYFILIIPFLMVSSCEDRLDRDWNNPNVYQPKPDEVVSGLFTHMQKTRFWMEDYGEWYWYLSEVYGSFSTISQINCMMPYSDGYINYWADWHYGVLDEFVGTANGNVYGKFERLYTDLTNYGLIRDEVSVLSGSEYDDAVIYFRLATVLKNVVALQTVDLFNSIPYFDAYKGTKGIFFTPYDDPMDIYKSVIEEYQAIAKELPGLFNGMSDLAKNTLIKQDIFFKGDIGKWVQYINAQTLKSSVRMSGVAADYVKPFITEAARNLPTEDFVFASPQVNENRIGISAGGIIQRGFYEQYYNLAIPDVIMARMNRGEDRYDANIDDPRLPAIAMGYSVDGSSDHIEYYGISMNWERNRYLRITLPEGEGRKINAFPNGSNALRPTQPMDIMVKSCPWTYYNPVTYVLSEAPLSIFSLAEVDLLLAEVELKGLASTGKSAGQYMNDAVRHSTDFWYMMNSVPNYAGDMSEDTKNILTPAKPSADIVDGYASVIQNEFEAAGGVEDRMEIIMQQKYIHLNIMEAFELFTELRRTRHPKLEPITVTAPSSTLVNATMMLERFKLPPSERTNNFDEYSKVMNDDKWGTPIFWVPQDKINEKYFLPEAIKPPLP